MSARSLTRLLASVGLSIGFGLIGLVLVVLLVSDPAIAQARPVSRPEVRQPLITPASVFTVGVAPCSTASIQACIDNSSVVTGDTIYIPAGLYVESLSLDTNNPVNPKWVSLIGQNRAATIVRAPAGERVLNVQGAAITSAMVISGLTFAGGDLLGVAGDCVQGPDGSCGGGILLWDQAQPLIQNVVISNNRALYGGGLYAAGGIRVTLIDVKVVSNSAAYGGGVLVVGEATVVTEALTLTDTDFLSNTATSTPMGDGGGAQVGDIVDPETGQRTRGGAGVSGSRFVGNQAARRGAGLYVSGGSLRLTNSEFFANQATTVNGSGGGVYASNGSVSLANAIFERNTADYGGGGAYVVPAAGTALRLDGGRFADNQGPNGGGLTVQGNLVMTGTEFLSNTASLGGGIYEGGGRLTFTGGRFVNNRATGGLGGGVYGVASGALSHALSGTQFISNAARTQGGGLHLRGSLELVGVQFIGNVITGTNGRGGGLYADDGAYAQRLLLTNTHFLGNAGGDGGGAYFNGHYQSEVRVVNALFAQNRAEGSGVGAVLAMNVDTTTARLDVTLLHATLADVGLNPKPAVAVLSGTLHLTNTILASHTIGISRTLGQAYEDYNLFFDVPITTSGIITSGGQSRIGDPRFLDPLAGDYHILSGSAAIDAGFDMGVLTDFEGDGRDATPDIGFDENVLQVPITGLAATNDSPSLLGSPTTLTATVSTGSNVSYAWELGDGALGSGAVVVHTYPSVGLYTAIVTASNNINTLTATTTITISDAPISGLSAANDSPTLLGHPTTLSAGVTSGSNVSYAWQFGDGDYGSGQLVTHTYTSVGTFVAIATATNSASGPLTVATVVTITSAEIPISGLSATNDSPTFWGHATTLTASVSAGTSVVYAWNFGDGQLGRGQIVTHLFSLGAHTTVVTATNSVSQLAAATVVTVIAPYAIYLPVIMRN